MRPGGVIMPQAADYVRQIKEKGYAHIAGGNSPAQVSSLLSAIRALHARTPALEANVPFLNRGHQMLYNLQSKDFLFVEAKLRHALVREILIGLLNDQWYKQIPADEPNYILRSMLARNGGEAPLPLHIDSFIPASGSYCWSAQVAFVLEDQNEENGCTVVVPGSHLLDRYADQEAMSRAVPVISKAGDIFIWDSRLWHGTRGNLSGATRWSFISTFGRWWLKQNFAMTDTFPPEFYEQLTDSERAVIGFCSIPPRDEYERIDIKGGYELLPAALPGRKSA